MCHSDMLYFVKTSSEDLCESCQAFPERFGPPIESIDYFGKGQYFSENSDVEAINWSSVVNFRCMQIC